MSFFSTVKKLDGSKENIIFTVISGKNIGAKLIVSDKEKIYTENSSVNWDEIISATRHIQKNQIVEIGEERIYVEYPTANHQVVICGAGHISMSMIQMCKFLNLPTVVIDDRPMFATNAMKAGADEVICEKFEDALDKIPGDKGTFFIIVTRGHRYDQLCLEKIIHKENAYIGMIGSKKRVGKVLDYLREKGISEEKINKVYTPIGLKIGAETPEEISVSIMAELIQVKNKDKKANAYSDEVLDVISGEKFKDMPKAMVTIVSRKGSAPREVGTKMMILMDGTIIGTVGGGCVESDLRQKALDAIRQKTFQLVTADMTGRDAEEDGMVCGGIIEAFIEPVL